MVVGWLRAQDAADEREGVEQLLVSGCDRIFNDRASAVNRDGRMPALAHICELVRAGDCSQVVLRSFADFGDEVGPLGYLLSECLEARCRVIVMVDDIDSNRKRDRALIGRVIACASLQQRPSFADTNAMLWEALKRGQQ